MKCEGKYVKYVWIFMNINEDVDNTVSSWPNAQFNHCWWNSVGIATFSKPPHYDMNQFHRFGSSTIHNQQQKVDGLLTVPVIDTSLTHQYHIKTVETKKPAGDYSKYSSWALDEDTLQKAVKNVLTLSSWSVALMATALLLLLPLCCITGSIPTRSPALKIETF